MPFKYGKIAIEEAWQLPERNIPPRMKLILVAHEAEKYAPAGKGSALGANLVDIHKQRLELMDKYGIEMQVLSLTSPGPQGTHSHHHSFILLSDHCYRSLRS
jgi:2,3-dihydroxybenzoate decarboxylase